MKLNRRALIGTSVALAFQVASSKCNALEEQIVTPDRPKRLVLRSSWQTVNIGDIAHTPGMLHLLETYLPDWHVTLWPNKLNKEVTEILKSRFPKLEIASDKPGQLKALEECDFFLHGSGLASLALRSCIWRKRPRSRTASVGLR